MIASPEKGAVEDALLAGSSRKGELFSPDTKRLSAAQGMIAAGKRRLRDKIALVLQLLGSFISGAAP